MDGPKTGTETAAGNSERNSRRRRWEMTGENIRYFLPKPGGSSERPELGQEMASEGEALVQAFKSGQVFLHRGRMEGGARDYRKRTEDCETGFNPRLKNARKKRVGTSFQNDL